ncbi:ATPase [Pasteurellaceae bacterium 15-036681]|nr:ATPase [Pasteurellaceae bacterium 15-036681]
MIKRFLHFTRYFVYTIVCSLLLVACEENVPPQNLPDLEQKSMISLSRALYAADFQIDPHFVTGADNGAMLRDLLVGLMAFDAKGNVVPAVAREWFSEDGMNWLFVLDENAKWSNGEPVTADDFVTSWQRLSDPANKSPLAQYLLYMDIENAKAILASRKAPEALGIKALNPQTLQIQLTQPNFQLPNMLAHIALLPTYKGKKPQHIYAFNSNGAYRLEKVKKDTAFLQAVKGDTPFQNVSYRLILAAKNPERFDIIENPLLNNQRNQVLLPRLCTYFYEFNFNDPLLKQKEIRQAIRMMISSPELSRELGIPNHTVLPRTLLSEHERNMSTVSLEQIIKELGLGENNPIRITLSYDDGELHSTVGHRLTRALAQSDLLRITPQELSWQQLLQKREQGDFQLIRSGWCADYNDPVLFLNQFHSQSADNKSHYSNAEVDQLLEKLKRQSKSGSERDRLILNIVNLLEQDVALIPLFQYQRRILVDSSIKGIDLDNTSEVIYSKDLYR